ncbi:MAG TPA: hypothetical protein VJU78_01130 [Chitinophagaceae bacterium]|nr:hypothetical protein [Chitinophagaceae bacterium]
MTAKRITTRFLKIIAFILGGIVVLMTAFHFWFIHHAEQLVEDIVSSQSSGKLKLQVDRFKFNWFTYKMELRKSVFYSTDTAAATSYQFSVEKINITVKEIFPLVFEKKILIDSIYLLNPDIRVTRLRSIKDSSTAGDTSLSIPQEMGRIYNSIQDALQVLKVDRFQIANGKFSLINKIRPADPPVVITNIHFRLENLQVDTTKPAGEQKILFSDNVSLHTSHQNILFPDGRHRLNFSHFRIDILNKIAEFDSCTIVATKGDSATNSFSIFFDKLQMTNIDFSTLYHNEIIKADSVYCINPRFRLDVDLEKRTGPAKSLPKLDELIQELTGDMQLAFVVVENGSFDINTMRDGRPSSFTSDHNNFELQGLQIKANDPKPLIVEKFVMAIRNYENFLRDSTYSIQFDSILLYNNRISLSNFTYQELQNNKPINSLRMPQFELQGLSWDELVFEQRLKAQTVTLYRPVIDYRIMKNKRYNTQDIFQTLAGIGNFMQLENLNINDGQINLVFTNNARLKLENANMSVLGKQLVGSRKLQNIQRSVVGLNFKKGSFEMGDVTADLTDVNFTGGENNHLQAGNIHVKNKNNLDVNAQSVAINSMIINDKIQHTAISGVSWAKAAILLFSFPSSGKDNIPLFTLKKIKAANTTITANEGDKKMSLFLQNLNADELSTSADQKPYIAGLTANGNDLNIENGSTRFHIKTIHLADHQRSSFENIRYSSMGPDSLNINIPKLQIIPDINAIINGKINTDELYVFSPDIHVHLTKNSGAQNKWPEAKIGKLSISDPLLQFSRTNENGVSHLNWKGKGNVFELTDFVINNKSSTTVSAEKLQLALQNFLYINTKGKTFDAGEGKLTVQVNKLEFHANEAGGWDWKGTVSDLDAKKFTVDSVGKKAGKLTIESAKLNNLSVSSTTLLNPGALIPQNTTFRLRDVTGSYQNADHQFHWHNTAYDKNTRLFSADSFSYQPVEDRDAFIAKAPYQTDYIIAKTGAIDIGPFNIDTYIKDTVLEMGTVKIADGFMTDYRDQRQPREPGIIRSLPVNLLKKIPVHLLVDTVQLNNAHIEYEEVNKKTNAAGKIAVAQLNGHIAHLRNYDFKKTDSLHINATAFLENKLFTKLSLKESYTDSLGGFLMNVQMGPADLTILNPMLRPLASAELRSGLLDSMTMRVTGREAFAIGEMKMVYHDFKIDVINNNTDRKRRLLSFFANSLVKNKNAERKGTVYFNRLRDRSAINYLVKITLSGVSSSIGIKKSDKLAKKSNHKIQNPLTK